MKRAIILVMDSVGIGELPDASLYGDIGSNTLGNIWSSIDNFSLPNLENLGLGNISGVKDFKKVPSPSACYGKMAEMSPGKDTTTGHWEMAGVVLKKPFPVYPNGFPEEIIAKFEQEIKTKSIGNYASSGTEIIMKLGSEHVKTGYPIVYTSADSVFQIAAHEDIIPIENLYNMCEIARNILIGEHAVGRVIARPFTGASDSFKRTGNRHDFSLKPTSKTILDSIVNAGLEVRAVGKIKDIFCGQGITNSIHTNCNMDGINKTIEYIKQDFSGLIFTNLVDFDMLYGHRNDVAGYANALKEFDKRIPEILDVITDDDILIITADHGCDPTTSGTDHTREYVPLLVYRRGIKPTDLGIRATFSDISKTLGEYFGIANEFEGASFLNALL